MRRAIITVSIAVKQNKKNKSPLTEITTKQNQSNITFCTIDKTPITSTNTKTIILLMVINNFQFVFRFETFPMMLNYHLENRFHPNM